MSNEEQPQARYLQGLTPQKETLQAHGARKAENESQYMLPTLQQMVKEKPNLRLLDVGCGPGSITLGLAGYVPEGGVVGLDLSDAVLEKARASATAQGVNNVKFMKGNVYELPFEDGSFDVMHTSQAVCHFHDHVAAIRELIRVTRKGGVICMREGDLHTYRFWPPNPVLEESWEMTMAAFRANGTDTDAGRQLKQWTVEAGIPAERIELTSGTWCHSTPEERRTFGEPWPGRISTGPLAEKGLEIGFCTKERQQEYAET